MVGRCKFCGDEHELIRAHIFPQSFTAKLWGTEGRLIQVAKDPPPTRRSPTGIYDENLLCLRCESTVFTPLDTYAYDLLLKGREQAQRGADADVQTLRFPEGDGKRIKLFALSVLWRASASKRPELSAVMLGTYQDKVRDILRGSVQLTPDQYATILGFELVQEVASTMMSPAAAKSGGNWYWSMWLGGYLFATAIGRYPADAFAQARSYLLGRGPDVVAVGLSATSGKRGAQFARAVQNADARYGAPWSKRREKM